ncbi:ABC transporter ATP-binding protein [Kitasatospora sp. NPDC059811]|uniref:ABC transporter ATP-binding protein n=1 Tax=Streptomycetaceae TaxID=2062 RepID=UPI000AAA8707|nr:ABC transporter ATP-binding protein [Streptomyces sp. MJM8645]
MNPRYHEVTCNGVVVRPCQPDGEVLRVENLRRAFPGTPPVEALRGVSFTVRAGEIVGLLGDNGAGKTTLLKILSTLLLPSAGGAAVCGADLAGQARRARRHIGVVFGGDRGLYPRLSALDNIMFFGGLSGPHRHLRDRSLAALEEVGLAERAESRVETFSKGMRQRLHLAVGMLNQPCLLMLDEPTIGLDLLEGERVREAVARLAGTGTAVLLTSHYPTDIDRLAGRVVLLESGSVSHDLPVNEFRRQAGFTAEVSLSGPGVAPRDAAELLANASVRIQQDKDGWRLAFQVGAWDADVLARLAEVVRRHPVTDIDVASPGVEAVIRRLAVNRG